jgi:hypothetical protein
MTRKRPGRPAKYGTKTARMGLYGPAETIDWVKHQAKAHDMKPQEFLLHLVEKAKLAYEKGEVTK